MSEDATPAGRACERCGRQLEPGAPFYDMRLRLSSGFDGHLPDVDAAEARVAMLRLVESSAERSAEELEAEVDLELSFGVCPRCRNLIAADPLRTRG